MSVLRDILEVGQEAITIGLENVTVELKTNYGPAIPIPTSSDGEASGLVSSLIGLRGGLIIRNSRGEIIETVGDPAPTNPLRFAALLTVVGAGLFVVYRGIFK